MADQPENVQKGTNRGRNTQPNRTRAGNKEVKDKENNPPQDTEKSGQSDQKQAEKHKQKQGDLDKILQPVQQVLMPKPTDITPKIQKKAVAPAAAGSANQMNTGEQTYNAIPPYLQQWTPNANQIRPQMQMYSTPPQFAAPQYQPMMQPMPVAQQYMQPMQPVVQYVQPPQMQYYEEEEEFEDQDDEEPGLVEPFGDYTQDNLDQDDIQDIDIEQFVKQFVKSRKANGKSVAGITSKPVTSPVPDAEAESIILDEFSEEVLSGEASGGDPALHNKFDSRWVGGFVVVENEEIGPPVRDEAQQAVDQFWDLSMKNSKSMQIAKDYKVLYRPSNCQNITFTQLNPLMKELLPEGKDKRDRLPFAVHTSILKGANGVVLALGNLMDPEIDFEGKEQVLTWLMQALKSLSYGNGRLMDLRRQQLKPYLPWHYHKIVDEPPSPSHQWLLGDKFEESIQERDRIMALVRKVKNKQFGGQRGGRGGRFNRGNRRPFRYQPYRISRSGGFRNGRSNIQYDQYGNPYVPLSNNNRNQFNMQPFRNRNRGNQKKKANN